jgi:hypothetical protein
LISVYSPRMHGADLVLLEVERDARDAVGELEQLAGHHLVEAVDAGDAVADVNSGAPARASAKDSNWRRAASGVSGAPGRATTSMSALAYWLATARDMLG